MRLYPYCAEHGVPHARLGKLIVATCEDEIPGVQEDRGGGARRTGSTISEWLSVAEATRMEPELHCVAALLSPSTGIIDSHALMLAYQGDAEDAGAMIALPDAAPRRAGARRRVRAWDVGGDEPTTIRCRILVNAAGLHAPDLGRKAIEGIPADTIPARLFLPRVLFHAERARRRSRRLIYPVPVPGGLGVHITLDLAGQARFGPDVEWISMSTTPVDPRRADVFLHAAVRRYWPGLRDGALQPGYAGIRPKISGPNEAAADFVVQGPGEHGIPGLVNMYGIESPGLTASLPLADEALRQLGG